MDFRRIQAELNIVEQAKKYGIPVWQHPQFLFLVMGLLIAFSSLFMYALGVRLVSDPQVVALGILILTMVLLAIASVIERSFERLAEAARLKSEFVSIVSHQLRAPLSNLKWIADLLVAGKAAKNQKEYYGLLKENSTRMQNMVNDLLTVSRLQEGGMLTQEKSFSLEELVDGVVKNFAPVLKASNITLKVQQEKGLKVFADPVQIRHVVSNLLDNAIKYTGKTKEAMVKKSGKKRAITIISVVEGKKAKFTIKDTGVGIPQQDKKYIFQKFFRSANVIRHETQGSGLGLYIAKSIVERAGGNMGFVSKEDKGSMFWFTIPLSAT